MALEHGIQSREDEGLNQGLHVTAWNTKPSEDEGIFPLLKWGAFVDDKQQRMISCELREISI